LNETLVGLNISTSTFSYLTSMAIRLTDYVIWFSSLKVSIQNLNCRATIRENLARGSVD